MTGEFELMVKVYRQGNLSKHFDSLKIGETVDFKHIDKNVKCQYPFGKKKIGILTGGTGITPMIQAMHAILGTPSDNTPVAVLYGSQTSDNILAKETLDVWAQKCSSQLSLTYVLSHEPHDSSWPGARGFINKDLIQKHMPWAGEDCLIFVCGPPPMYDALCGPRDEPKLTGLLADLGFKAEQVFKF